MVWKFLFSLLWTILLAADLDAARVRVAIPSTTHAVLAFTTSRDKGYYRDEGLDVELILMSAPIASRALVSGDVEAATVGGAGLPPVLSGAPLRFLFTTYNRPMFWLFGKSDLRTVKELKGKKVGVSGIGSGPDSLLREALRRNGLEGGRDVAILSLGVMPTIYSGLQSGVVDAAMLSPPFTFRAEEHGFRELIAFTKQDLVELQGSILVREAFLRSDSATLEKFIRATYKGFLYIKHNRAGTIPILGRYLGVKEDLAEKAYDQVVLPAMTHDGMLNEDMQKKAVEHVLKRLEVKEPPPLSRIFDFSIARKIVAEVQTKGWKPGS
ncbi:MAG TPA: ABC transporter substrate-binding protein [Candidatus Binatia bacterium]|nr:ABC transporter substrate-binding protein [Candidatus Binatia bacterium]